MRTLLKNLNYSPSFVSESLVNLFKHYESEEHPIVRYVTDYINERSEGVRKIIADTAYDKLSWKDFRAGHDVIEAHLTAVVDMVTIHERVATSIEEHEGFSRVTPQGHKLFEARQNGRCFRVRYFVDPAGTVNPIPVCECVQDNGLRLSHFHVFTIEHDWAAVVGSEISDDAEIRLPFPYCAFELRFAGVHYCVFVRDLKGRLDYRIYCNHDIDRWFLVDSQLFECLKDDRVDEVMRRIIRQIRATCVVMEEPRLTTVERVAPSEALQKSRVKQQRIAPAAYHVVRLARSRIANPISHHTGRSSPRLHFRRGHWNHYPTHKTWVRWTLVGDPSLGVIEKHYSI